MERVILVRVTNKALFQIEPLRKGIYYSHMRQNKNVLAIQSASSLEVANHDIHTVLTDCPVSSCPGVKIARRWILSLLRQDGTSPS